MTEEEFREEIKKMAKNYEGIIRDMRDEIGTLKTELEIAWLSVGKFTCANTDYFRNRAAFPRLPIDKKI